STRPATVRVRYAPSPTGYLHLGGLRTALFNYLFAKSHGGDFLMRIEDTDQTRKVEGSVEALTKSLQWCGIHEDEGPTAGGNFGPYVQSERLHVYKSYADTLVEVSKTSHEYQSIRSCRWMDRLKSLRDSAARSGSGTMYDRACLGLDQGQIDEKLARGDPHTIRLKVPEGKTTLKDLVRGYVQFDHSVVDDQVLMKSDGFPTYHLAHVVDDHLMGITHVIRGEEWLSSTPKHLLLYKFLGFRLPEFAHLGLLLNEDRSKLSKRQGDVAVEDFQKKGFLAPALVNFVALLGWNPSDGNKQEIFSLDELQSVVRRATCPTMCERFGVVFHGPRQQEWLRCKHRTTSLDQLQAHPTPLRHCRQSRRCGDASPVLGGPHPPVGDIQRRLYLVRCITDEGAFHF
ncbi:hypothetical protein DYB32_000564, partial [Aphanomyces invadans]